MSPGLPPRSNFKFPQRHRAVEWLKYLNQINREPRKAKALHLIAGHCTTPKHPAVQEGLGRPSRFPVHVAPTSAFGLDMGECSCRDIIADRLRGA